MPLYLSDNELDVVFWFISQRYGNQEEVPIYRDNREGVEKLLGVLERVRWDTYYPTLLDKATYLLISINKGHFFSNGNKRLALSITTAFLIINGKQLQKHTKEEYKTLLTSLFPGHTECTDFPDFTSTDFVTYNLSIIIADSARYHLEYAELKDKVHTFLSQST